MKLRLEAPVITAGDPDPSPVGETELHVGKRRLTRKECKADDVERAGAEVGGDISDHGGGHFRR
jgi:hypothetical protein